MKLKILIIVLIASNFLIVERATACEIKVDQTDCCVEIKVDFCDNPRGILKLGDGSDEIKMSVLESPIYNHCYSDPGNYTITFECLAPDASSGGFAIQPVQITQEDLDNCDPDCPNYICWEDFIGYFDLATGLVIRLPGEPEQEISFEEIYGPVDGSWCAPWDQLWPLPDPIPASIPVEGGYCDIGAQIIHIIQDLGYDITITPSDPTGEVECFKGNDPTPGYFINSEVEVITVYGVNNDGSSVGLLPRFNGPSTNCDN